MRAAMRPTVELIVKLLFFNYAANMAVGKFDFTVHMEVYQNPNNWRHTGTCCDNVSVNGTCKKCDTKIFFCLRRYGASLLTIYDRTLSTSNCHLALFETSLESLPRDIHIISSSPWPNDGLLQLYMRIVDVDGREFILTIGNLRITGDIDPDDVIDEYTHLVALRPGSSLPIQSFTGVYVIATWRAGFSVECSRGYFGSECEGVCSLPDHGNFVCLDNDTFTCEEGWRGQSCNDCIPTAGCSRTGGYCNTPGECMCREGYNGTHCEYPMCRQGCHSVGGFCSTPGECVCRNGWSGERCDQCIPASGCSTTGGYCLHPGECRCRIGFVGDTCSTPISVLPPCMANNTLCQNGGTCINVGTSHSICVCPPSHSGLYCEEEGSTGAGTEQLDRSSEGDGSTWVRPLVDVVIALTVVAGAVIITVIVAKVFLKRRAVQQPNHDAIGVIQNDQAGRPENEDPQAQGGHEQAQVAEQRPNPEVVIIEDHQVEPQEPQIQGGRAVGPQLPPNQPPHCVVPPLSRGNNENEQRVIPLAESVPQLSPDFLNQHFQPPANDPWDVRIPNRIS